MDFTRTTFRPLLPFAVATVTAASALQAASEENRNTMTLAESGTARYSIASPENPTAAEAFAAAELAGYLEKISGASFPVSNEAGSHSIVVTERESLPALAPSVTPPDLRSEGFMLFSENGTLYLVGADARGVTYAVYRFLEELGCRWLAPDYAFYEGSHERIPERAHLTYTDSGNRTEKPVLQYRKLYVEEGRSHTTQNLLQLIEWMPKIGYNILVFPTDYQGQGRVKWDDWREALTPELQRRGIVIEVGGHGYQNFLSSDMEDGRLFEEHPEWFGMEDGERTRSQRRVFCTSNDQAVSYLHRNVVEYLQARPEIEIFDFWPPDGARWCECDACDALGGVPERHARLVAQTQKLLAEEVPEVRLECIAYGHYREPPEEILFGPDVLVDFCPIAQVFESQIYEEYSSTNITYQRSLTAWLEKFEGDVSIYSYYRKYAWRSLPIVIPYYIQRDLQWYREQGVRGISIYAEPGDWVTYEINHYMLGRLAWNPSVELDEAMDTFLRARYGPGAEAAKTALSKLERIVRRGSNIPGTTLKDTATYDEWIAELEASIEAVGKVRRQYRNRATIARNLERLNLMQRYAAHNLRFQRSVAAGAGAEERRKSVTEIADLVETHADEGVFLVPPRLTRERLYRYYGVD